MALKDKLMTLEDFKAVRDVDVASNSAQFTEIKADLDAQAESITQSVNVVVGNRNLIAIPTGATTTNGITYTADGDTVTATGTASANSIYSRIKFRVPISGNYSLSGCPKGGSSSKYYVRVNGVNGTDYGNGVTVELEAFVEYTLWIIVAKNAVVSDTVFALSLVWAGESVHSCSDAIDSLRQNVFEFGTVTEYDVDLWERGYITPATGDETYVTNRLRTKRYLPKNIYSFTVSNGYKYLILGYGNDDTYIGCWDGINFNYSASWSTAVFRDLSGLTDYNLRLIMANANDGSLTVQDADNITFNFFGYKTDKTLTKPDAPADAKITGDMIRNIVSNKNIYSSIADMKSDTTLILGTYCVTTGYYTANDGGGASYVVRSKTASDVDNGGTIHLLNNGYVAELITDTPNTLNIKQWGAKSDGESDISDAYSRCIEYIIENYPVTYYNGDNGVGGGTIFFPAGIYKTATRLEARHYVEICGENEYTTIITSPNVNAFYASMEDYPDTPDKTGRQNNFRVKNITFYNCSTAIQLRQSIGTVIENCQFIGCARGILLYLTVKVTIRNCLFRACTNGVFLGQMGVGPSTTVFIEKCWFRHCSGAALKVVGTDNKCGYQPCSLIDTIFEYNNQSVDVEGSETYPTLINFARCFFEGNTNAGTIINASVVADIQNFFAPIGSGINVTPAEYNKVNISNLSDVYGFTVITGNGN